MKKLLYSFAFLASVVAFGQQAKKAPLVLVEGAVASENFVSNLDKKLIESVNVYKNNVPEYMKKFENSSNGGIDVKLKYPTFDKISVAQLNNTYKLPVDTPISFDGILLKLPNTEIIYNAITSTKINEVEGRKMLFLTTTTN